MRLAELLDLNVQSVRDWESGKKAPMLERLPAIATALGISMAQFFPADMHYPSDFPDGAHEHTAAEKLDRLETQMVSSLYELREFKKGLSQET